MLCDTWSITLREEHRLRVFENRLLRRICEPKRDEVTGGWIDVSTAEIKLYAKMITNVGRQGFGWW
jgi:hypothetical protein